MKGLIGLASRVGWVAGMVETHLDRFAL